MTKSSSRTDLATTREAVEFGPGQIWTVLSERKEPTKPNNQFFFVAESLSRGSDVAPLTGSEWPAQRNWRRTL